MIVILRYNDIQISIVIQLPPYWVLYYANPIHAEYKVEEKPKGRVYVNQTMRAT